MTKPDIGDRHEVQLTNLTYSASAVGQINGVVTFVHRGAPSETAHVEITEVKKRHLHARINEIVSPSPDRCSPPCPYFDSGCGGCQWQHINVDAQLDAKERVLIEALNRIGGLSSLPEITRHPAPQPLGYRNNIRLTVTAVRPRIEFGFKSRFARMHGTAQEGSHDVLPIDRCEIALPAINRALSQIVDLIEDFRYFQVEELTLRTSSTTGEVMLILIFPKRHKPPLKFADKDLRGYPAIHSIYIQSGERGNPVPIAGKRTLSETASGLSFEIGPKTFFQNNLAGLEQLVGIVRQHIQVNPPTVAIDAHCGVGTFTLPVAQTAKAAFGLDLQTEAITLATNNAKTNGITNTNFRVGHLGELGSVKADLVLLDPPRGGCWAEDLEALARITPQHILYVSCNPTTLTRDLSTLSASYEVTSLDLVDLFPMTYHFETVVGLRRS
ncbi:23S rRNA (uracil(1939)-C(5))-methyltransferase RlmD [Candidatus Poribacteria bacterium]|nr:MAG: 23S rRNA (uracil(1939)-C(5))-methyltransferase RlmD [Candidatus Poribacteria bacterium]